MKCSLCKKNSSKLVTYRLCKCCSERVESGCRESIIFVAANEEQSAVRKVECDVCQEPVLKDELEQHRETCCPSRKVFRCTVCDAEYQHKDDLWGHLDEHEIQDEAKDICCGETNVMYELHKCDLCNDHRVYRESHYWNHVHEDHDGYFLKCSNCDETFRSRKLKTEHDENHCWANEKDGGNSDCGKSSPLQDLQTDNDEDHYEVKDVLIEYPECEDIPMSQDEDQLATAIEKPKREKAVKKNCPDCGLRIQKRTALGPHHCIVDENALKQHQSSSYVRKQCPNCGREFRKLSTFAKHKCEANAKAKVDNSSDMTESLGRKENSHTDQPSAETPTPSKPQCPHCKRFYINRESMLVHIRSLHRKARCTICGLVLANYGLVKAHRLAVHIEKAECPHCKQRFSKKNFQNHLNSHSEASHLCPDCGMMFKSNQNLQVHLRRFHTPGKTPSMKRYIRHGKSRNRVIDVDENATENSESQQEGS
ncbi:AAEL005592-PA [Aedes aegypti]|uniref:C2H2-type domain-containing protein n=2 Tax=Aedes aegypti TaxID=7159 RepID=A0A903U435_AEDAE|nr:zinc finger protein 316 [Aedes aegypti]EAT42944.1 AAEL005592-PA [Aedes aegypti]